MKWRRFLGVALVTLLVTGCGSDQVEAPLDRPTFKALLLDVMLLEAGARLQKEKQAARDSLNRQLYAQALQKHAVSKEAFLETLAAYRENPKELRMIYQELNDSVSARMEALSTPNPTPTPAAAASDSVTRKAREALFQRSQLKRQQKPNRESAEDSTR